MEGLFQEKKIKRLPKLRISLFSSNYYFKQSFSSSKESRNYDYAGQ